METQAYFIRAYCEPNEWNVTIQDIADATGYARNRINQVLRAKGWLTRCRSNVMDYQGFSVN